MGSLPTPARRSSKDGRLASTFTADDDLKILIPVEQLSSSSTRPLVERDTAYRLLAGVGENAPALPTQWEARFRLQLELLERGTTEDNIKAMELSLAEAKAEQDPDSAFSALRRYKQAKKLVVSELSVALGRPACDIDTDVEQMLEA